jgi:hypothetical protein
MYNWLIIIIVISLFTLFFSLPFIIPIFFFKKNKNVYDLSSNKNYQWYPNAGFIYNLLWRLGLVNPTKRT